MICNQHLTELYNHLNDKINEERAIAFARAPTEGVAIELLSHLLRLRAVVTAEIGYRASINYKELDSSPNVKNVLTFSRDFPLPPGQSNA